MGKASTPFLHTDSTPFTSSSKVNDTNSTTREENTKDGLKRINIKTPIAVGVSVGMIAIGAIAVVWYIRRRKGENTNVEEATEEKGYSQVPVNDIQVDDGSQ